MGSPPGLVDGTADRARRWLRSDPRNVALAVALPISLTQLVSEWRWHRSHDVPWFSLAGTMAYLRARPGSAAIGVVAALLPDLVGVVVRVRAARRR